MATHDYNIANGSGLDVRTDLNAVLEAILSQNSSATEPPVTMAGMLWYDTANSLLKQRNATNDAWLTKWDTTKGQLATLASPTFTGNVALPLTTLLNGKSIAITDAPTFTGTASFVGITASGTVSLPAATSIGAVSQTELSYLDGVTSAIQTQLNGKQATLVSGTNIKTVAGQSLLGSGNIVIQSDTISSIFANSQTFTASGTFTVPAGVTKVLVEGCGGGGAGGGTSSNKFAGSGGGGSVGGTNVFNVVSGSTMNITIGAGGVGSTTSGGNGGTTSISGAISLNYIGGTGGTVSTASGSVSLGGNAFGLGGNGGNGLYNSYTGYGGTGLYGVAGGSASFNTAGGSASANTGAGGGGTRTSTTTLYNGGNGGSGKVIIYW